MNTRKLLSWTLFFVGVIILTFFRNYIGNAVPYRFLIYAVGLICFIVGLILLFRTPKSEEYEKFVEAKKYIEKLKSTGDQLLVDLELCEIKENDYYEEQDYTKDMSDLELLMIADYLNLFNKFNQLETSNHIYQCVAVFKTIYKGKETTFNSPVMNIDKTNLLMKFIIKKQTTIYIDKNDSNKYFFDVEFIYTDANN